MGEQLVQLADLTKRFGPTEALLGLTCELRAGEVVGSAPMALARPRPSSSCSGCCGRPLAAPPCWGSIAPPRSREVKERLGYCPDEPAFYDFLTGRETLDFSIEVRGLDREAAWKRLEPMLPPLAFGPELLDLLRLGLLAYGMKKKLAVLRGVNPRPARPASRRAYQRPRSFHGGASAHAAPSAG